MKILIGDAETVSRRLLEGTLMRLGHEVTAVVDGRAAIDALLSPDGPRLAILDWSMPNADGPAVCFEIRQRSPTYLYLILLAEQDSKDNLVAGLDSGADDFLTKPLNIAELSARLRAGMRVLELQTGLLEAQEKLRAQATRDDLTGLWNRRMILEQLGRELNRARHERRPLAVALADLDGFKQVNDDLGHAAGDRVLREAAGVLRSQIREYDFIGRYGGEEFLVLLPGCDAVSGRAIAERVRSKLAASPVSIGAQDLTITASIGLAWTGSAGPEPGPLIHAADNALYRAKAHGKNRVEE